MLPQLRKTIIVFHISAIIYFLLSLASFGFLFFAPWIFPDENYMTALILTGIFTTLLVFTAFICGAGLELVIWGLKRTRYWAWITGLIIAGLFIPSGFIVLGIIGLLGLVNKDVIATFEAARKSTTSSR
jgi:hypothetical protein